MIVMCTLRRLALTLANALLISIVFDGTVFSQLPTNFQKVELLTGLRNAVNFEFAPDGRIFIMDRYGEMFIYKPQTQTSVSAGTLDVFHDMEDGLLGLAFDPLFLSNNFVYIHYSHPTLAKNRVSRFRMNGDQLDLSSEVVVIEWTSDRNGYYHAAGDMDFDSHGNLYIAIGDNTNHTPYAPLNENDANQSAERTSSNTNDLRGKILRIKPEANGSYSIPEGNLFPNGVGGRPEIYVMGTRNPYKIFVDKSNTDWLFWGEVGPDANTESEKGPEGMDEINLVKNAGNFGWPYITGKNEPYLNTYRQPNFYYDHASPVNLSRWNTGAVNLPAAQPSWLEFFHQCHLAGPRYYYDPAINNPRKLPSDFHEAFFYYDFNSSKIWVVTMDGDGNILTNQRFAENVITGSGFIDLKIGPDGQLYILEYGAGCCPGNVGSGKLVRVDYNGIDTNKAPLVNLQASKVSGSLPLTIDFSSEGTVDPDGDDLTFEWDFQSDGTIDSNIPDPSFTYTQAGTFNALLRVRDDRGAVSAKSVAVYPGNSAAVISFNYPPDGGMISWEDRVQYQITVTDAEDGSTLNGSIACSDVNFVPAFGHLNHSHDGLTINQCAGSFNLDPVGHDAQGQDDIYYVFKANYTDSNGLTVFEEIIVHPKIVEGEFFDAQNNTKLVDNTDVLGGGIYSVRALTNNAFIMLDRRNLHNISAVDYRISSSAGGIIEVHADSPGGALLSTATVPVTGTPERWTNVTAPITNPGGKHDLYFVFKNPGAINLVDLNYIEFKGEGASTDPTPPNIYDVQVLSKTQTRVRFNEPLDAVSSTASSNYFITGSVHISSVSLEEGRKSVLIDTSPLAVGVQYQLTISNIQNESGVPLSSSLVTPLILDEALIRINAAGPLVDVNGVRWNANQYNAGGTVGAKPSQPINNTTSDIIYQTEMLGNFSYNIPIPDRGVYDVRLHFAELVYKNPGERIFNVNIEEGQRSLLNYDIYSKVGYSTAIIETLDSIIVEDGFLNIVFSGVKSNAKISAIEVYYGNDSGLEPSVKILNPGEELTLIQPFNVTFQVNNWWIGSASSHIQKFVDGIHIDDIYDHDPISISGLTPGPHTIKLVLATAEGVPTIFHDEVQVHVADGSTCLQNPFPLMWEEYVIGSELPYRAPHIRPVDIDGDGYLDVVTGGWWYKNPRSPEGVWSRNVIGPPMNNMFLVYDLDRDGDPDMLGTRGMYLSSQVVWARNDGKGNFTIHTNIPEAAGFPPGSSLDNTFLAGSAVGNFNNVENIQVALVWNGSETTKAPVKLLTVPLDPVNGTWLVSDIAPNAVGEAIHAIDIDKDGDLDLSQIKNWLRNDNGLWTTMNTGLTMPTYYEHHLFADLDKAATLDGVMTQIGDNNDIYWFSVPANPTQTWTKTTLGTDVDGGLSLDIVDLDFDGDLDVITGEWKIEKRLIAFENDLCNTGTWIKHILHPGGTSAPDHHDGTQAADLDNDGDLDIISVGWDKRIPRIYINNSSTLADNDAPIVLNPIPDQGAVPGSPFNFIFADNTFDDPDGDALTYSANLLNGNPLPPWLSFNSAARQFTGTPPIGVASNIIIKVTANDGKGGKVTDEFFVIFPNVAPVVSNPIPDQVFIAGAPINFIFSSNTFTDANTDTLIYSSASSDGSSLPAWLSFSSIARAYTGNPELADLGVYEIRVTASDGTFTVSDDFTINVLDPAANQPPAVSSPIPDVRAIAGSPFEFILSPNSFTDPNEDTLTYAALLSDGSALPDWLSFDSNALTFHGTPDGAVIGSLEITVTANDGTESASDNFILTVEQVGSVRINSGGPTMTAYGVQFSDDVYFVGGATYSNNSITDIAGTENDALYKSERGRIFSYQIPLPPGEYIIRLHFAEIYFGATGGGAGGVGKRIFNVTGEGQPLLTNLDIFAEVGPMTALIREVDLIVSDGVLNLSFVKVVENPKVSAIEIIPKSGAGNSPPVVANPIPDQNHITGSLFSFSFSQNTFADANGDDLTYTASLSDGSDLPSWLGLESATRTFSGTPVDAGVYNIRVTASDSLSSVSDVYTLTVVNPSVNQPPVVNNPIPDQSVEENMSFTFAFAADAFIDPDGDTLFYTSVLSDDNPLPGWLTFDAQTRRFSGTPAAGDAGETSIKVVASDGSESVSQIFTITVLTQSPFAVHINSGGPQLNAYGVPFENDQYFIGGNTYSNSNIVDIAGTDDDELYRTERSNIFTYNVPVPAGTYLVRLHFAEIYFGATGGGTGGVGKRVFNVLAEGQALLTNFDIIAEAGGSMKAVIKEFQVNVNDGTLNLNFNKVVQNPKVSAIEILALELFPNQPPFVNAPIADQNAFQGVTFDFTFASNTFSDPNNDPLTFAASLANGDPLPEWLTFSSSTRNFNGIPGIDDVGTAVVQVTASDGHGGIVSENFDLSIRNNSGPPAGIRINAGGTSYTNELGAVFSADFGFSGGAVYTNNKVLEIAGTSDDFIYKSERYRMAGYDIPVAPGTYDVTLHFAEIYFGATGGGVGGVGKRVFNVLGEGIPLLTDFDIYSEVGAMRAVAKTFQITVEDGVLNLTFEKVVENPKVSAIVIIPVNTALTSSRSASNDVTKDSKIGAKNIVVGATGVEDNADTGFSAFPNPFHGATLLTVRSAKSQQITLQVTDMHGVLVSTVFAGPVESGGVYKFDFDASGLPSGFYIARLITKDKALFFKLVLNTRP